MSVPYRYAPILKARQAELSAMAFTSDHAFSQIIPVVELVNFPPALLGRRQDLHPALTASVIEKYIVGQLDRIVLAVPQESKIFIDLHQLSRDILWRYPSLTKKIFTHLYLNGVGAIPVIHADTYPVILDMLREIHSIIDCGFMIRVNRLDMLRLSEICHWLKCPLEKIDLLLDYGSIHDENMDALVASAAGFINNYLPSIMEWRSLTLASGAFPSSIRDYFPAISYNFSRLDWRFWYRLIQHGLKRNPWFSDYGILHPGHPEPRGKYSSAAALPYATSDKWNLLWEDPTDLSKFRNCCKRLCDSFHYDGPEFSYADRQIMLFASGELDKLDATDRRIVGFNRHFEQICSLLPN